MVKYLKPTFCILYVIKKTVLSLISVSSYSTCNLNDDHVLCTSFKPPFEQRVAIRSVDTTFYKQTMEVIFSTKYFISVNDADYIDNRKFIAHFTTIILHTLL